MDTMTKTALELAIEGANTRQLQAIYEIYWGAPTSNRNAQALRARILKHDRVQADIAAQRVGLAKARARLVKQLHETTEQRVKRGQRVNRARLRQAKATGNQVELVTSDDSIPTIAEYAEAEALGAAAARKLVRRSGGDGGSAPPAPALVPGTTPTRRELASVPAGIWLMHAFKDGRPEVRVYVKEAMTQGGTGGVFEWAPPLVPRGKYQQYAGLAGLRQIVRESSGHMWNVLLYFRRSDTGELLKPYPVHKDRLEKRAARQATGLTDAEREQVKASNARDLDLVAWVKSKAREHAESRLRPLTREANNVMKFFGECPIKNLTTDERYRTFERYLQEFQRAKQGSSVEYASAPL